MIIRYDDARRACPIIECSTCGVAIRDAKYAAVALAGDGESPVFVCKGTCHDRAEAELASKGHENGWMELEHYLVLVLRNVGVSASDIAEAMRAEEIVGT